MPLYKPALKNKKHSAQAKRFSSSAVGGIRKRLSALGALRRRKLSRYDIYPGAKRRALQQEKSTLSKQSALSYGAVGRIRKQLRSLGA